MTRQWFKGTRLQIILPIGWEDVRWLSWLSVWICELPNILHCKLNVRYDNLAIETTVSARIHKLPSYVRHNNVYVDIDDFSRQDHFSP